MKAILGTPRVEVALRWLATAVGALLLLMGIGFLVMPELLATGILAAEPARADQVERVAQRIDRDHHPEGFASAALRPAVAWRLGRLDHEKLEDESD
jgi:hypothetical protein